MQTRLLGIVISHEKDPAKAQMMFQKLLIRATDGDVIAQHDMGLIFECGCASGIVQKEPLKAYNWYLKAAKKGFLYSQEAIFIFGSGDLCFLNKWKWIKIAKSNNSALAKVFYNSYKPCIDAISYFLCLFKFTDFLKGFDKNVVMIICELLWRTRNENCWKIK